MSSMDTVLISAIALATQIVQSLYFIYMSEISRILQSSVTVQAGLCQTLPESRRHVFS